MALCNFQLPWDSELIEFFDGTLLLPVVNLPTYSTCKLLVTDVKKMRKYDAKKFEEQLFFFNNDSRCHVYEHKVNTDFS